MYILLLKKPFGIHRVIRESKNCYYIQHKKLGRQYGVLKDKWYVKLIWSGGKRCKGNCRDCICKTCYDRKTCLICWSAINRVDFCSHHKNKRKQTSGRNVYEKKTD